MAVRDWIREIVTGAVGSVLADQTKSEKSTVTEEQRAALFLLLQELPSEVSTIMWKRHQEAKAQLREHQFVSALTKIPKEQRKESVTRLAQANDSEFWQAVDLLSPKSSATGESVKRLATTVDQAAGELADKLEPKVEEFRASIKALTEKLEERTEELKKKKRKPWIF